MNSETHEFDTESFKETKPRHRSVWFRLTRAVVVAYVTILVMMVVFETSLVFPIPKPTAGNWAPDFSFEEVDIEEDENPRLVCWLLEHADPQNFIIVFHGNGQHVAQCAESFGNRFRQEFHATVLIVDYQGYGKCEGSPSQTNICADSLRCFDYFTRQMGIQSDQVVVHGQSMGGAPAIYVCQNRNVRGLVLDSTFDCMGKIAAQRFPFLPVRLLMRNQFPSEDWAADLKCPVIQFHRTTDEVISIERGEALFKAIASADKTFVEIPNGGHNSPIAAELYQNTNLFLDRLNASSSGSD